MSYRLLALLLLSVQALGEQEQEGASFKEGVGLHLGPASKVAIGLELADVEEKATPVEIHFTAQIYREAREVSQNQGEPAGFAYASAWVDPAEASRLAPGLPVLSEGARALTGAVVRVDRTMAASGGRVEVLIQLQGGGSAWRIGDFAHVSAVLPEEVSVTMIPRAALLETAYGPFAYVVNGSTFLRTAVETGARHGDHIEITEGLYSGDQVVVRPVETLYLIELRATKGGGHSH